MVKIDNFEFPEDLYYTEDLFWVRVEGDSKITYGLSDLGQDLAQEIEYVDLVEVGEEVEKNGVLGTIESGKWVGTIRSPAAGVVTEINEELEDNPKLINTDPYGKGWILKMKIEDVDELDELHHGPGALEWLRKEMERRKRR
jgi:glycine cleavage system H protein